MLPQDLEPLARALGMAARSLGLSRWQALRFVVLPQAIRVFLPPYGNTMIMMLKDSSIASAITVAELTRGGQLIAASIASVSA